TLGQMLQGKGDAADAAQAFAEADRLRKLTADAQAAVFAINAGRERVKQQDLAGAVQKFREAVRLAPDNAQAHYQLALALRREGRNEEAAKELAAARRLAPYLRPPPIP